MPSSNDSLHRLGTLAGSRGCAHEVGFWGVRTCPRWMRHFVRFSIHALYFHSFAIQLFFTARPIYSKKKSISQTGVAALPHSRRKFLDERNGPANNRRIKADRKPNAGGNGIG